MKGIERHGNGYRFRLYMGTINGKKRYEPSKVYPTPEEAFVARQLAKEALKAGSYVSMRRETVRTYFTQWLEDKKLEVRPGTYRAYEWLANNYIIQPFGELKVDILNAQLLQSHYQELFTSGTLSAQSVTNLHRVFKQALTRAVQWGLVKRNVASLL